MPVENLWGDIPVAEIVPTPASVLRSQGTALSEQTGGQLTGKVSTQSGKNAQGEPVILQVFQIVAPSLGNYSTEVLRVTHPVTLYPARIRDMLSGVTYEVNDDTILKDILSQILQSANVRQVLKSLLSQIADVKPVGDLSDIRVA